MTPEQEAKTRGRIKEMLDNGSNLEQAIAIWGRLATDGNQYMPLYAEYLHVGGKMLEEMENDKDKRKADAVDDCIADQEESRTA